MPSKNHTIPRRHPALPTASSFFGRIIARAHTVILSSEKQRRGPEYSQERRREGESSGAQRVRAAEGGAAEPVRSRGPPTHPLDPSTLRVCVCLLVAYAVLLPRNADNGSCGGWEHFFFNVASFCWGWDTGNWGMRVTGIGIWDCVQLLHENVFLK